jgi:hypothetical protein
LGKLIDIAAAAEKLKVSAERVRVLCRERRISGARFIGGRWFVREDFVVTPGKRGPAPTSAKAKVLRKIQRNISKAESLQRQRTAFEKKQAKEK